MNMSHNFTGFPGEGVQITGLSDDIEIRRLQVKVVNLAIAIALTRSPSPYKLPENEQEELLEKLQNEKDGILKRIEKLEQKKLI